MEKKDYDRFYQLQNRDHLTEPLSKIEIQEIKAIINRMQFSEAAKNSRIILLGDELADRGSNDYLMLLMLNAMHKKQLNFEIMLSNHGIEHMFQAERNYQQLTPLILDYNDIHAGGKNWGSFVHSLRTAMQMDAETKKEMLDIYNEVYKSRIKLFTHRLSENSNRITLYYHGCVGLETFKGILEQLNEDQHEQIPFKDKTRKELAETMDHMNRMFAKSIKSKDWFSRLVHTETEGGSYTCPLVRLTWERNTNKTAETAFDGMFSPEAVENRSYEIDVNHGHEGKGATIPGTERYVTNLDNETGSYMPHVRPTADRGPLKTAEVPHKKTNRA